MASRRLEHVAMHHTRLHVPASFSKIKSLVMRMLHCIVCKFETYFITGLANSLFVSRCVETLVSPFARPPVACHP
jgi:hypothetical protein